MFIYFIVELLFLTVSWVQEDVVHIFFDEK